MAPRNLLEWIAGGNLPRPKRPQLLEPPQLSEPLQPPEPPEPSQLPEPEEPPQPPQTQEPEQPSYPPQASSISINENAFKTIVRFNISTNSDDSGDSDTIVSSSVSSNSSDVSLSVYKKVRFTEPLPQKSAMKKGAEKASLHKCSLPCQACHDFNARQGSEDEGEKSESNHPKQNAQSQNEQIQRHKHNKNSHQNKQLQRYPLDTYPLNKQKQTSPNQNNDPNNYNRNKMASVPPPPGPVNDGQSMNFSSYVRLNPSRIVLPAHSQVVIREDVLETSQDPRPNAYFDKVTTLLRVYHGPIYGNQSMGFPLRQGALMNQGFPIGMTRPVSQMHAWPNPVYPGPYVEMHGGMHDWNGQGVGPGYNASQCPSQRSGSGSQQRCRGSQDAGRGRIQQQFNSGDNQRSNSRSSFCSNCSRCRQCGSMSGGNGQNAGNRYGSVSNSGRNSGGNGDGNEGNSGGQDCNNGWGPRGKSGGDNSGCDNSGWGKDGGQNDTLNGTDALPGAWVDDGDNKAPDANDNSNGGAWGGRNVAGDAGAWVQNSESSGNNDNNGSSNTANANNSGWDAPDVSNNTASANPNWGVYDPPPNPSQNRPHHAAPGNDTVLSGGSWDGPGTGPTGGTTLGPNNNNRNSRNSRNRGRNSNRNSNKNNSRTNTNNTTPWGCPPVQASWANPNAAASWAGDDSGGAGYYDSEGRVKEPDARW